MPSIEINKLGPVEKFQMDIADFTVLTGEQATGKSTIAKSIFFFKDIPELLIKMIRENRTKTSHPVETADLSLRKRLVKAIGLNFRMTFGFTQNLDPEMKLKYVYKAGIGITVSSKGTNIPYIGFSQKLRLFLDELDLLNEWNFNVQNKIRALFDQDEDVIYIPAGRSMITLFSDNLPLFVYLMNDAQKRNVDYCSQKYLELIFKMKSQFFSQDISSMIAEVRNYTTTKMDFPIVNQAQKLIAEILQGDYRNVAGQDRLYLEDGQYVKINFAASGQQEAVWILNVLFYYLLNNKRAYFIIEEPESHLYPNVQRLISDFIALASAGHNRILLTTHSPYVLGELNNLLYAGKIAKYVNQASLNKIIPQKCWLQNNRFAAYYTNGGRPIDCMDEEHAQIKQDVIDGASDTINEAYEMMLSLKSERQGEEL